MATANMMLRALEYIPRLKTAFSKATTNSSAAYDTIGNQLQDLRAEYWVRRALSFRESMKAAPAEFNQLKGILSNPGEITLRQAVEGSFVGLHLFGMFCTGEVFGKKNLIGYKLD